MFNSEYLARQRFNLWVMFLPQVMIWGLFLFFEFGALSALLKAKDFWLSLAYLKGLQYALAASAFTLSAAYELQRANNFLLNIFYEFPEDFDMHRFLEAKQEIRKYSIVVMLVASLTGGIVFALSIITFLVAVMSKADVEPSLMLTLISAAYVGVCIILWHLWRDDEEVLFLSVCMTKDRVTRIAKAIQENRLLPEKSCYTMSLAQNISRLRPAFFAPSENGLYEALLDFRDKVMFSRSEIARREI